MRQAPFEPKPMGPQIAFGGFSGGTPQTGMPPIPSPMGGGGGGPVPIGPIGQSGVMRQDTAMMHIPGASMHEVVSTDEGAGDRVVEIDRDMYACETYPKAGKREVDSGPNPADPGDNYPSSFPEVPGSQRSVKLDEPSGQRWDYPATGTPNKETFQSAWAKPPRVK